MPMRHYATSLLILALSGCTASVATEARLGGAPLPNAAGPAAAPSAQPTAAAQPAARQTATPWATPGPAGAPAAPVGDAPAVALMLTGQVKVDPQGLLDAGLAERTATGVALTGANGPGAVAADSVGLVMKTKYAALAAGGTETPIQGLLVRAVSLRTGEVLAGPVATDVEGRYRLGFLDVPDTNLRIEAYVSSKPGDPVYTYDSFVAAQADAGVSDDAGDTLAAHLTTILAARVQAGIDMRKANRRAVDVAPHDDEAGRLEAKIGKVLNKIPPEAAAVIDQDGKTARRFAERVVSYADLALPAFGELRGIFAELVAFSPAATRRLAAGIAAGRGDAELVNILIEAGMAPGEAAGLKARIDATSAALNAELSRVANQNPIAVLEPLLDAPDLAPLKPLLPALIGAVDL